MLSRRAGANSVGVRLGQSESVTKHGSGRRSDLSRRPCSPFCSASVTICLTDPQWWAFMLTYTSSCNHMRFCGSVLSVDAQCSYSAVVIKPMKQNTPVIGVVKTSHFPVFCMF